MAKSNAELQRDKRAKEKAWLERIGAKKRSLIVSKALDDAAALPDDSVRFASMSRLEIVVKEKWSRQLENSGRIGI